VSHAFFHNHKAVLGDPLIGLGTAPIDNPFFRAAMFEQLGNNNLEGPVTTDIAGKKEEALGQASHSFSMILGDHPTGATATIHVGRRLLQRHDGGGGNEPNRDVVELGNGNVRALRAKQSRSSPGSPGLTCALS
jgi:hypothetical protein